MTATNREDALELLHCFARERALRPREGPVIDEGMATAKVDVALRTLQDAERALVLATLN